MPSYCKLLSPLFPFIRSNVLRSYRKSRIPVAAFSSSTPSSNSPLHQRKRAGPRDNFRGIRKEPSDITGTNSTSAPYFVDESDHHRFLISPEASESRKFHRFLECLRDRSPIPGWSRTGGGAGGGGAAYKSILYTAPYLADWHGYVEEFTSVANEWFHHVRPLLVSDIRRGELATTLQFSPYAEQTGAWKNSMRPLFNIANMLEYLGRINQTTNGRLVEKLGWSNVSYLARRMAEHGFFTFTFSAVTNSALKGLCDFYQQDASTSPSLDDRSIYIGGLQTWMTALAHYLSASETKPMDWHWLVNTRGDNKSSIPAILARLNVLDKYVFSQYPDTSEIMVVYAYVKNLLCGYAKTHFGNVTDECKTDLEKGRLTPGFNIPRTVRFLNDYAELWSRFHPDLGDKKGIRQENPEDYARGTWQSWYETCNVVLAQLIMTEEHVNRSNEPKEDLLKGERLLSINYSYLSAQGTLRLLFNAAEIAWLFEQTDSFYGIVYEAWRTMVHRFFDGAPITTYREAPFLTSLLIRLPVLNAKTGADADYDAAGDTEMETEAQQTWNKYHEDTIRMALSFLNQLSNQDVDIPYRAMVEITEALAELKELPQAAVAFSRVPMENVLVYLRKWCASKRERRLAYNAATAAVAIKKAIGRMQLPPSEHLHNLLAELDRLEAIGRK